ncbi:hypothetical protein [Micromonospora sp. bgisy143]|uniref:hypothetical protein n=1 Tax=Micromonospora sp. bgisy143 TaxID=3413790 RepID=UPI003EBA67F0
MAIADFMGLIREASDRLGLGEYEVRVQFEWNKTERLQIWTTDGMNFSYAGSTILLAQYTPIEVTVRADAESADFYQQVYDLVLDCLNQGGIAHVQTVTRPRLRSSRL